MNGSSSSQKTPRRAWQTPCARQHETEQFGEGYGQNQARVKNTHRGGVVDDGGRPEVAGQRGRGGARCGGYLHAQDLCTPLDGKGPDPAGASLPQHAAPSRVGGGLWAGVCVWGGDKWG